nr:MAG TPA: hypothetical protein [Caudoviricetes sp.]
MAATDASNIIDAPTGGDLSLLYNKSLLCAI